MLVTSRQRGVTLIELMVVVAMIAIVSAIAAPAFGSLIATMRLKTMAGEIQSAMTFARSEAMKRNAVVTVTPATTGWQGGWQTTVEGVTAPIQTRDAFTSGADGMTTTYIRTVTFRPNGRCTSPDSIIALTSSKTSTTRCVKLSLTGIPIVRETCS